MKNISPSISDEKDAVQDGKAPSFVAVANRTEVAVREMDKRIPVCSEKSISATFWRFGLGKISSAVFLRFARSAAEPSISTSAVETSLD